jgi:hypothetical protein
MTTVKPAAKFPVKWEFIAAALCAIWGIWLFIQPGGGAAAPIANPTVSMGVGGVFLLAAAAFAYKGTQRKEE